ncbi:head-tail connector protein [Ewingella allii]|uniref:head-tail connector protein n=1 Tax=Ewingella allii TaxID=3092550 RepID=UPI0037BD08B5
MLELNTVKAHCRVDADFTLDDELFKIYSGSAKRHVEKWTRRKLYQAIDEPGFAEDDDALLLDDDIRSAMLLCIGHWYANREGVVIGETAVNLPLAVQALLQPYRIYGL